MSFLQHSLCQCKQSVDPSVQISNFIVATALKILTMGFFVSFLTQGKNPTKTQEDLMMNTLTPFQTLSIRLFFWTKWCSSPLHQTVCCRWPILCKQMQTKVNVWNQKADRIILLGMLQNSQWFFWWGWWYKNTQFWKTLPAMFTWAHGITKITLAS